MYNVAMLLNDDATMLYNSWVTDYVDEQGSHGPYATIFKDQTAGLTKVRSRVSRK